MATKWFIPGGMAWPTAEYSHRKGATELFALVPRRQRLEDAGGHRRRPQGVDCFNFYSLGVFVKICRVLSPISWLS
jgi:hypothetical protein